MKTYTWNECGHTVDYLTTQCPVCAQARLQKAPPLSREQCVKISTLMGVIPPACWGYADPEKVAKLRARAGLSAP
jgi:hypothetical protein